MSEQTFTGSDGEVYVVPNPDEFENFDAVDSRAVQNHALAGPRRGILASQNGWTANDRSFIATYSLPGGKVSLRKGDVSVVLLHAANRWHNEVEPLVWPGNWGYAERTVRGSETVLSNHASGTALDCNAPAHPLGTQPSANFSAAKIAKIHEIIAFYEGAVRWGGDYTGRKDGMHIEINTDAFRLAKIVDKIRGVEINASPVVYTPPTPPFTPAPVADKPSGAIVQNGDKGQGVREIQDGLNRVGFSCGAADGDFGDNTEVALRGFQQAAGIDVDGVAGPATRTALGKVPGFPGITKEGYKNSPITRAYQQRLKDRKWKISVDGDHGPATTKIIKQFQAEKKLTVDGMGGSQVWTALYTRSA